MLRFVSIAVLSLTFIMSCSTDDCKTTDQFGRKKKDDPSQKTECKPTLVGETSTETESDGGESSNSGSSGSGSSGESASTGTDNSGATSVDFGCGPSCNSDCKMYLMGGQGAAGQKNSVYSSSDGSAWTQVGTLPGSRVYGGTVVFGNKLWYLGGHDGSGQQSNVWYSSNGVNWSSGGIASSGRKSLSKSLCL